MSEAIAGVLFDLDGTLLDTAPDLVSALNRTLLDAGIPPCPAALVRPHISGGARAMLGYWLHHCGIVPEELEQPHLLPRMLERYEAAVAVETCLFEGMETVLATLDAWQLPWGIVTNKVSRFTDPLLRALALTERAACIVSGDSTPERKPHPLPLQEACRRLRRPPADCVYVGDAKPDIDAGREAGLKTLVAGYGYLDPDDDPRTWGASAIIDHPSELLVWLAESARC